MGVEMLLELYEGHRLQQLHDAHMLPVDKLEVSIGPTRQSRNIQTAQTRFLKGTIESIGVRDDRGIGGSNLAA